MKVDTSGEGIMPSSGTMLTVLLGGLALAGSATAGEPQKVWEASGFRNPESAVYDPASGAIYVSNVNGEPAAKDGNGFISKLTPDGKTTALEWVKGLDAPKGLALAGGRLYAADIDRLVEIDVAGGEVVARHDAPGAKFLNDLTADAAGRVYASDMATSSVWVLEGGKLSVLVRDDALDHPNGLLAEAGRLVIASWGSMGSAAPTQASGHLRVVDLATKRVSDLGTPTLTGKLDGVVPDGKGGYLVTDWVNGGLFRATTQGESARLLPLKQGSADLGTGPGGLVLIPMMMEGTLLAYRID
jgi:DNA-binding beta-propeller fold protein YncE